MDEFRPTGRLRVIAATLLLLTLVVVLVDALRNGSDSSDRAGTSLSVDAQGVVPAPDLAPRFGPALASFGDQLFVYGGSHVDKIPSQIPKENQRRSSWTTRPW